jgi:hypothetical protein
VKASGFWSWVLRMSGGLSKSLCVLESFSFGIDISLRFLTTVLGSSNCDNADYSLSRQ